MVQDGHAVSVLAMRHDPALPSTETADHVKIYRAVPLFRLSKGFVSWDWLRLAKTLVQTHDEIVIHAPQAEGVVLAALARWYKKRLVCLYHCDVVLPRGAGNRIIEMALRFCGWLTILLSDRVVTYTEDYARSHRLLQSVRTKLSYKIPPVSIPKSDSSLMRRIRSAIGSHTPVIGVAARLSEEKGIEYLLAALPLIHRTYPNACIVIAGPMDPVGEAAYKQKMLSMVEIYKKHVVFVGSIPPQLMGSFYRCLDVLVLPSVNRTEAFGLVQVEAMLCGVPVVASDLPGVRVPVRITGMGLTVPIKNSSAIGRAVVSLLDRRSSYIKSPSEILRRLYPKKPVWNIQ